MPRLLKRIIYDDNGASMYEGKTVLINGNDERFLFFDDKGEISVSDWDNEEMIWSVEYQPEVADWWPPTIG